MGLSKDVFSYGRNTQSWLLLLREDLITFIILHQLKQLFEKKHLSRHGQFLHLQCPRSKLGKFKIMPYSLIFFVQKKSINEKFKNLHGEFSTPIPNSKPNQTGWDSFRLGLNSLHGSCGGFKIKFDHSLEKFHPKVTPKVVISKNEICEVFRPFLERFLGYLRVFMLFTLKR